jgi:flagellin-specific chaperone FliS
LSKNDSQLGKDIHDMYERANQEVMEANLDTLISALDEI